MFLFLPKRAKKSYKKSFQKELQLMGTFRENEFIEKNRIKSVKIESTLFCILLLIKVKYSCHDILKNPDI